MLAWCLGTWSSWPFGFGAITGVLGPDPEGAGKRREPGGLAPGVLDPDDVGGFLVDGLVACQGRGCLVPWLCKVIGLSDRPPGLCCLGGHWTCCLFMVLSWYKFVCKSLDSNTKFDAWNRATQF